MHYWVIRNLKHSNSNVRHKRLTTKGSLFLGHAVFSTGNNYFQSTLAITMVVMVIKNGITGKLNNCLFVLYRNYTILWFMKVCLISVSFFQRPCIVSSDHFRVSLRRLSQVCSWPSWIIKGMLRVCLKWVTQFTTGAGCSKAV